MARINRETIMKAILKGLNKAQVKYLSWTKDMEGVSLGAEYVLTTYVAEQIAKKYNDYVFIEEPIQNFVDIKTINKKLYKGLRAGGRTDIALYNSRENKELNIKAIVELKNNIDRLGNGLLEDINRIKCLLDLGMIEYGIIAFVTEYEEKKDYNYSKIEKKIQDLIMQFKNEVPSLKYKYVFEVMQPGKTDFDSTWGWGSCVVLFSKKA